MLMNDVTENLGWTKEFLDVGTVTGKDLVLRPEQCENTLSMVLMVSL